MGTLQTSVVRPSSSVGSPYWSLPGWVNLITQILSCLYCLLGGVAASMTSRGFINLLNSLDIFDDTCIVSVSLSSVFSHSSLTAS